MCTNKAKGYSTLFAGSILMMYNGSAFIIGNISPYIWSYFPDCTKKDSLNIYSYYVVVQMLGNLIGANVIKARILHPKLYILLVGAFSVSLLFWSSF